MNDQVEQPEKKGGGKKWMVIILLLLLFGSGGAAAWYFLLGGAASENGEEEAEAEPIEITDPVFVKVGPMTVNIQSARGDRLLYTSMMIKVGNEDTQKFLETNMPDINNRMLILLSQQKAEELNAPEGKQMVADRILEALEEPFADPQPELTIESVFFQDFIVQ